MGELWLSTTPAGLMMEGKLASTHLAQNWLICVKPFIRNGLFSDILAMLPIMDAAAEHTDRHSDILGKRLITDVLSHKDRTWRFIHFFRTVFIKCNVNQSSFHNLDQIFTSCYFCLCNLLPIPKIFSLPRHGGNYRVPQKRHELQHNVS